MTIGWIPLYGHRWPSMANFVPAGPGLRLLMNARNRHSHSHPSPNPKSLQESPSLFTQPRTRPSISIHPPFHHPKAHLDSHIGRQHPEVSMADGVRDVFVADGLQQAHSHIRKPRIGPEGALACQSLEVGNLFMV